jgi:hypothetical protein
MNRTRVLLSTLAIATLLIACSTDLPRLTSYRNKIWSIVAKLDHQCVQINDLLDNRGSYPTYRAIQMAEDITNQIGYAREELREVKPPDPAISGNDALVEAADSLAQASAATEDYAADPNAKAQHDKALLYLRTFRDQRDVAVNRISKALEAAGLVAQPPETPIPGPSKVPPADAKIFLE